MADLTGFPPLIIYLNATSFDWNCMKRIKTNARVYVELYLGHVNIGNGIRIRLRLRTSGKTCIVQKSVWESMSVSVSVGGNKPLQLNFLCTEIIDSKFKMFGHNETGTECRFSKIRRVSERWKRLVETHGEQFEKKLVWFLHFTEVWIRKGYFIVTVAKSGFICLIFTEFWNLAGGTRPPGPHLQSWAKILRHATDHCH